MQVTAEPGSAKLVREWLVCSLIFLATVTIFLSSRVIRVSDAQYTLLLTEQIIDHGTLRLDHYFWRDRDSGTDGSARTDVRRTRHVQEHRGHLYYIYPYGTSILSVPFALAYRALGESTIDSEGNFSLKQERRMQKIFASILMAAACVIFYLLARSLLPRNLSIVVAATGGLGSQVWSTAATGLWSHTWNVVILSLVCLLLLRAAKRSKINPILLATLLSWGFFVRPTAAIYVVGFSLLMWTHFRSRFLPFIAAGLFWLGLFLLYSFVEHGALPHYYARNSWSFSTLPIGLYGQLLSPSRGLLIFVPPVLIVGYLLAANWRSLRFKALVNASLLVLVLHTFAMASQSMWWAGVSYGPRLYTDVVPIFVLLGAIGIDAERGQWPDWHWSVWMKPSHWSLKLLGVVLCISAGVFINGAGALSPHSGRSGAVPYLAAYCPLQTLFDWTQPPFVCAVFPDRFCPYATSDEIAHEFRLVDQNDDAAIDQMEYETKGFRSFSRADRNADSRISLEEWQEIYGKDRKRPRPQRIRKTNGS